MKLYYTSKSRLHNPQFEINNGEKVSHPENAQRVEVILQALASAGFEVEELNREISARELAQIHTKDFIDSLERASNSIKEGEVLYPDVFLRERIRSGKNVLASIGQYSFDVYTPVLHGTYEAAMNAAGLALRAAREVGHGMEGLVYALTHPIGHHALPDKMGGYSYFNNAAIAAEHLSKLGKVAILDLDFHHGNGTQEIFYNRSDVLFVSLHVDPRVKFPYYYGYADERGEGEGLGFNINFPLPLGTDENNYQKALEKAVARIRKFNPEFLVISLGFDTFISDPIGGFKLRTPYYERAAETIKSLNLPTIIVQEGGYDLAALGQNLVSFLRGYS
jgi:acetoin utilization deacetylase AcuC-like enzyme